jgi:hypothetical protein
MNRATKTFGGQCCAPITDRESLAWRQQHGRSTICGRSASYEVEGKKYCGAHASVAALAVLMNEETLEDARKRFAEEIAR